MGQAEKEPPFSATKLPDLHFLPKQLLLYQQHYLHVQLIQLDGVLFKYEYYHEQVYCLVAVTCVFPLGQKSASAKCIQSKDLLST